MLSLKILFTCHELKLGVKLYDLQIMKVYLAMYKALLMSNKV